MRLGASRRRGTRPCWRGPAGRPRRGRDEVMKATRISVVAAVALCAVTVTAGLALARVFADGSFALPVVLAAVIPHTIGYLSRRRRGSAPPTVLVPFVAVLLFVAWLFAGHTTAYGAPLPGTLRHL